MRSWRNVVSLHATISTRTAKQTHSKQISQPDSLVGVVILIYARLSIKLQWLLYAMIVSLKLSTRGLLSVISIPEVALVAVAG